MRRKKTVEITSKERDMLGEALLRLVERETAADAKPCFRRFILIIILALTKPAFWLSVAFLAPHLAGQVKRAIMSP